MTDALDLGDKPDLLAMRPGLRKLLTEGQDWRGAVRLIAMNPVLKAEAARVFPMLNEALTAYPDKIHIEADLMGRCGDYGLDASMMALFAFDAYTASLWPAGISPYILSDAFRRWQACELYPKHPARHSVYPKPDELRALCGKSHAIIVAMRFRVNKALAVEPSHHAPKSEADRAAVRAMASSWVRTGI